MDSCLTRKTPRLLPLCGFFHVVDGNIRFQRGCWDAETWYKQVGLTGCEAT